MPILSKTGYVIETAIRRAQLVAAGALRLADAQAYEKGPDLLPGDYLSWINKAGTDLVYGLGMDANNNLLFGQAIKNNCNVSNFSVTTAQIKAGTALVVPALTGFKIRVYGFRLQFAGAAATAVTIRLSDTKSSPNDIAIIPVANAADGDVMTHEGAHAAAGTITGPRNAASGDNLAVQNLGTALEVSKALQIRDLTANTLTGTTGVTGYILFDYTT